MKSNTTKKGKNDLFVSKLNFYVENCTHKNLNKNVNIRNMNICNYALKFFVYLVIFSEISSE